MSNSYSICCRKLWQIIIGLNELILVEVTFKAQHFYWRSGEIGRFYALMFSKRQQNTSTTNISVPSMLFTTNWRKVPPIPHCWDLCVSFPLPRWQSNTFRWKQRTPVINQQSIIWLQLIILAISKNKDCRIHLFFRTFRKCSSCHNGLTISSAAHFMICQLFDRVYYMSKQFLNFSYWPAINKIQIIRAEHK